MIENFQPFTFSIKVILFLLQSLMQLNLITCQNIQVEEKSNQSFTYSFSAIWQKAFQTMYTHFLLLSETLLQEIIFTLKLKISILLLFE